MSNIYHLSTMKNKTKNRRIKRKLHQEEYDKAEGIRRSDLWLMNKTPFHFKYAMDHERESNSNFEFGIAAHKYILEPETFDDEYTVADFASKRTKEYKEFAAACIASGKEPISSTDMAIIKNMKSVIDNTPLAKQLLTGEHEKEFYWTDSKTGEKCKVKCDCLTEYLHQPCIVDYKTTASCDDGKFEHSCREYGYDFQAGMYTEGVFSNTFEDCGFCFVAQEKTAPYAVRVYVCDESFIKNGRETYDRLLALYHECKETGNWYGYDQGPFGLPVELMGDFN